MAYSNAGKVISMKAAGSLAAYRLVYCSASGTANYVTTNSSYPIGVTIDTAESSGSVSVQIDGVAKVYALTSIGVGDLVCMSTDGAGMCKSANADNGSATSTNISVIGVALEAGSNSAIIPVLLQIHSPLAR